MANKTETRVPLSEKHNIQIHPETVDILITTAVKQAKSSKQLARTFKPLVLQEKHFCHDINDFKNYPDVYYIAPQDVDYSKLRKTDTKSYCPYKGYASYYALTDGNEDVAWVYEDPYHQVGAIKGHLAFYPDKVDISYS